MSETNGTGKRILSLDEKRATLPRKGNDYITVQQCYDLVIQECAKVHEYYLTQIPGYVANMIADALVDRGLIPEFRTGPKGEGNAGTEAASTEEAAADTLVPADVESATQPDSSPEVAALDPTDPATINALPDADLPSLPGLHHGEPASAPVLSDECERIIANMPEELRAGQRAKFEEYYAAKAAFEAGTGEAPSAANVPTDSEGPEAA